MKRKSTLYTTSELSAGRLQRACSRFRSRTCWFYKSRRHAPGRVLTLANISLQQCTPSIFASFQPLNFFVGISITIWQIGRWVAEFGWVSSYRAWDLLRRLYTKISNLTERMQGNGQMKITYSVPLGTSC